MIFQLHDLIIVHCIDRCHDKDSIGKGDAHILQTWFQCFNVFIEGSSRNISRVQVIREIIAMSDI
ncbi:hypothetical protein IQ60_10105 [Streptomyces europaeiscabiei]|nr:hypothetical protein IQ60_10105 [Streptomyces europaeiscabiei]